MLPPTRGRISQRSVPWTSVSTSASLSGSRLNMLFLPSKLTYAADDSAINWLDAKLLRLSSWCSAATCTGRMLALTMIPGPISHREFFASGGNSPLPQLSASFAVSVLRPALRHGAAARLVLLACLVMSGLPLARAEDGYDLCRRYRPVEGPWAEFYAASVRELVPPLTGSDAARNELSRAIAGLLGRTPVIAGQVS